MANKQGDAQQKRAKALAHGVMFKGGVHGNWTHELTHFGGGTHHGYRMKRRARSEPLGGVLGMGSG